MEPTTEEDGFLTSQNSHLATPRLQAGAGTPSSERKGLSLVGFAGHASLAQESLAPPPSPPRTARRPLAAGQRIQSRLQNAEPGREGPAAPAILKQPPLEASRRGRHAPAARLSPHWPLGAEARPRLRLRPWRGEKLPAEARRGRGDVN